MFFLKKRIVIAKRNLELCFPNMDQTTIKNWIIKNFESVGMGLIETGMAWFWPSWRIQRWCKLIGIEHITEALKQGNGVLIIGVHFLTLELGARVINEYKALVGVYRPNDNKLLNYLQVWGRLRSGKYLIPRTNIKEMINALKNKEILWYAPDHDYGPRSSIFVPLFAVKQAATTTGTYLLAKTAHPVIIPFCPYRKKNGDGYTMVIYPPIKNFPLENKITATHMTNQIIEQQILHAPTQYMWMHRRFKTRPKDQPSLYEKK